MCNSYVTKGERVEWTLKATWLASDWPRGSEPSFPASLHYNMLFPQVIIIINSSILEAKHLCSPNSYFSFENNTLSTKLKAETAISQTGPLNSLLKLKTQFRYAQLPTQALVRHL